MVPAHRVAVSMSEAAKSSLFIQSFNHFLNYVACIKFWLSYVGRKLTRMAIRSDTWGLLPMSRTIGEMLVVLKEVHGRTGTRARDVHKGAGRHR